ncbi:MAG: AI-2E family transporter [Burkholderiales bacterium]
MNPRLQAICYGSLLAFLTGWVLFVGRDIFVPIVFSTLVVYMIIGLDRLLGRVPGIGPAMPPMLRFATALAVGVGCIAAIGWLVLTYVGRVAAVAPTYQASLLALIQAGAKYIGLSDEPTWETLWQSLLGQVNVQSLIGSTMLSAKSVLTGAIVVVLYVAFLLIEQRNFAGKVDRVSSDPRDVARIRQVIARINHRVGAYLALKTFVSALLGVTSAIVLALFGVEFAVFWALLIALLNYIPYIGSFLGVFFPVAWAIVQFGDAGTVLAILAALTALQFVIGNFLDPYLMGNSLNLSPFVILASLTVWSALWGIPGAFLAVPITAIIAIVLSEFDGTRAIAVLLSRDGRLDGDRPQDEPKAG